MRIAIVDDNASDIKLLRHHLEQYMCSHQLLEKIDAFPDGRSFVRTFQKGLFDICFLDICMDDLNGISVAEEIRAVDANPLIVFTTTSAEYAVESYRVRAFHYLLKPLTYAGVSEVMALCDQALAKASHYIQIKCGRDLIRVPVGEIVYTDYSNHYIYLYTTAAPNGSLRTGMTFAQFFELLREYPQFLNCYRNMLINMDAVLRMEQDCFFMSSGITVPMWRNKKTEMRQKYADYMFAKVNGR